MAEGGTGRGGPTPGDGGENRDRLGHLWHWFAENQFHGYSPIYERIAHRVGDSPEVLDLVRSAPPDAHFPPVLLGAVHFLLLGDLRHPLGDVYAGRSGEDPGPLFVDLVISQRDQLLPLLATRRVQTNDCGRSALIGPGLTWIASRLAAPVALVDVGASAGLNLIADRYRLEYGAHGSTGPAVSPVVVRCEVTGGDPPIAAALPTFTARIGLDRSPIDLGDPDDARWLMACVWPDTGRLDRTAASIRLARDVRPEVRAGDAVGDLPGVLDDVDHDGAGPGVLVMNTWSFSYLPPDQQAAYVDVLRQESRHRPVGWLIADDGSALTRLPFFDRPVPSGHVLAAVLFAAGSAAPEGVVLASVQQHGGWIEWLAGSPVAGPPGAP